jgi:hypothetical protein
VADVARRQGSAYLLPRKISRRPCLPGERCSRLRMVADGRLIAPELLCDHRVPALRPLRTRFVGNLSIPPRLHGGKPISWRIRLTVPACALFLCAIAPGRSTDSHVLARKDRIELYSSVLWRELSIAPDIHNGALAILPAREEWTSRHANVLNQAEQEPGGRQPGTARPTR